MSIVILEQGERDKLVKEGQAGLQAALDQALEDFSAVADLEQLKVEARRDWDALEELEEPYRETLLLRYFEGLSPKEIAARLFVSEKTVKTHVYRIFKKMKVNTRTQAVMKAVKAGMI